MRAGDLDRKIVIQALTVGKNSDGAPTESWSTHAEMWAKVEDLKGTEYLAAKKEAVQVSTRFYTRYVSGVLPSMRISYDSAYYNIEHAREMGRRSGLEILATRKI